MPKIKTNGIELYYESYGKGDPLIFIAGFGTDHLVWQGIINDYAAHYQVIVTDNRGVGLSDCPDLPYTIEMMADDIAGLCEVLQLKNCHFIGNSMGGTIVQTLALKYPALCRSIVLSNTFTKIDVKYRLFAQGKYELVKSGVSAQILTELSLGWSFSSEYLAQAGTIDYLIANNVNNPNPFTEVGYRNQSLAVLEFDSSPWLNQITAPTLVVGSDSDLIVSEAHMRQMAASIPNAQFHCFKNVGHIPHIETPKAFNHLVLDFIKEY